MPLPRPNLTNPVAGAELAAGRVLWLPDFPESGQWGSQVRDDVTGRGNAATLSGGPLWVQGPGYGMALDYDGTNDYSEISSSTDLSSTACTWAASFRTSQSVAATNPWIFGRAGSVFSEEGVYFHISQTTGYLRGSVKDAADYVADITGTVAVNDGLWHRVHLVVTGGTTSDTVSLYLDGVLVGTDTPDRSWSFGANPARTAISTDVFWGYLDGEAANEAVWSRALQADEVLLEYQLELASRAPVRRLPIQQAFNTGGGTEVWDVAEYAVALAAWTLTASGPASLMWEPPAVAVDAGTWAFVITTPYSIVMTWENPPAFAVSLSAWSLSVGQPPSTIRNPLVARVPRSNPPEAMTRFTEKVAAILNGLSRYGQIVQFGPTEYRLYGAAYLVARAPTASDDESRGYFEGVTWINTSVTPRTAYMLTDATEGAATWLQL